MLVAVTGTPGVGKTTVCDILRDKYEVIDVNGFAKEHGCYEDFDEEAGSYNVDTDRLNEEIQKIDGEKAIFLDGHLSHFVKCESIIVLRCSPIIVSERLKKRDYKKDKVIENVQAEILDVILCESKKLNENVFEIDCTDKTPEYVAKTIENIIINKKRDGYLPGKVNWIEEMEKWF